MSTSPVVPQPLSPLTWMQKHERLLIVLLVLLAGSWGLHGFLANQASKAETRATVAEQVLSAVKAQNAQQAAQEAALATQYALLVETLTKQNAALNQAVAARQTALVLVQAVDKALPLPALAKRMQTLAGVQDADISADIKGISLTQNGAVSVASALESVPVLGADLADTKAVLSNTQSELTAANGVIVAQGTQITGLNAESKAADVACKAEVSAAKKRGRLQSFRWFVRGFFVGLVSGIYVGHAI